MSKTFRPSLPTIASSYYANPDHGSIKEKLGDFLHPDSNNLPMYKDKPNFPPGKRKATNANKAGVAILFFVGLLWLTGMLPFPDSSSTGWTSETKKWASRRETVRQAFITSWDHYAEHAWGMDEFHPVSQTSKNMGCAVQHDSCPPTGWIIVDALDTAMMMNLTSRVAKAREWISTSLDFSKVDSEMSTFETTIRVLGGLLSAHWLSTSFPSLAPLKDDDVGAKGEDLYIEKAVDLADRLLGAFDTETGIPLSSCILNTSVGVGSKGDMGSASTAEATTLQLELKYVAKLTGEPFYWEKAERVMEAVDAPRHEGGLVPIFIDPKTGAFRGENIRVGSRGDSYYEYLIKQYLQTGSREQVYLDMWDESLEGMKKHLITWSENANLTVLAERQNGLDQGLTGKMDHLVCFLPGTIALGVTHGKTVAQAKAAMGSAWGKGQDEDMILAEELMKTCYGMYAVTPTGLAPEIAYFNVDTPPRQWNSSDPDWKMPRSSAFDPLPTAPWRDDYDIHSNDVHNLQRPETIESLFYMWRITQDTKYREWGWEIFQSFLKHTAIYNDAGKVVGYTSIKDVNHHHTGNNKILAGSNVSRDNMEGFWLAETLKYFYLLFEDQVSEWNDLEKVVINTEAHFLPRFDIGAEGKVWKTGWERKERGSKTSH
ncbi:mannosyl-oligosaccharide alpha-1,2-mannosidase [Knufia obscura]|uniref:alpha-1,2-Mannosidase n=2 Tax=Knufia TaxID=430999 RepID=A0AAN8EJJ8_9EURO|nr:mannosyl-oligosaccharide alpha-1,2-mannosidase [Knufia obscura]KAK5952317.1 mannosyl-oligosaccharide alpha-1,2-mannosidase [Knufia fluminis]